MSYWTCPSYQHTKGLAGWVYDTSCSWQGSCKDLTSLVQLCSITGASMMLGNSVTVWQFSALHCSEDVRSKCAAAAKVDRQSQCALQRLSRFPCSEIRLQLVLLDCSRRTAPCAASPTSSIQCWQQQPAVMLFAALQVLSPSLHFPPSDPVPQ